MMLVSTAVTHCDRTLPRARGGGLCIQYHDKRERKREQCYRHHPVHTTLHRLRDSVYSELWVVLYACTDEIHISARHRIGRSRLHPLRARRLQPTLRFISTQSSGFRLNGHTAPRALRVLTELGFPTEVGLLVGDQVLARSRRPGRKYWIVTGFRHFPHKHVYI